MSQSIQDLVDMIPGAFIPEKAAGVNVDIQAHISGDQGGDYVAQIHDQRIETRQGTIEKPNLTVTANAQDILDMAAGKLDPMRAFMMGKVKISGDTRLAMQLVSLFRAP